MDRCHLYRPKQCTGTGSSSQSDGSCLCIRRSGSDMAGKDDDDAEDAFSLIAEMSGLIEAKTLNNTDIAQPIRDTFLSCLNGELYGEFSLVRGLHESGFSKKLG